MNAPTALHLHIRIDGTLGVWRSADEALQSLEADGAWRFVLEHTADLPTANRAALLRGLLQLQLRERGVETGRFIVILQDGDVEARDAGPLGPPDEVEPKWWGSVDVLAETEAAGIYRLNLDPGGRIPTHIHERMDESEYVLTDGLTGWWTGAGPRVLPRGHSVRWPIGLPHGYQNDTTAPQAVLCIDRPPFDPSDEILLEPDAPAPAGFQGQAP